MHFSLAALVVLATTSLAMPTTPAEAATLSKRLDNCGTYGPAGSSSLLTLFGSGKCQNDDRDADDYDVFHITDNCLQCEWFT
jgi:hypothetical protein